MLPVCSVLARLRQSTNTMPTTTFGCCVLQRRLPAVGRVGGWRPYGNDHGPWASWAAPQRVCRQLRCCSPDHHLWSSPPGVGCTAASWSPRRFWIRKLCKMRDLETCSGMSCTPSATQYSSCECKSSMCLHMLQVTGVGGLCLERQRQSGETVSVLRTCCGGTTAPPRCQRGESQPL